MRILKYMIGGAVAGAAAAYFFWDMIIYLVVFPKPTLKENQVHTSTTEIFSQQPYCDGRAQAMGRRS